MRGSLTVLSLFVLTSATQTPLPAAEPPKGFNEELAKKFAAVAEWEGFFEATEAGSVAWSVGAYWGSVQTERMSHGRFRLTRSPSYRWEPERGLFRWGGDDHKLSGEATAAEFHHFQRWSKWGDGEERTDRVSGQTPLTDSLLDISLIDQRVSVRQGDPDRPRLTFERVGRSVHDVGVNGQRQLAETSLNKTEKVFMFLPTLRSDFFSAAAAYRVVSNGPGVLVFACEGKSRADTQRSTPEITHRSRVILFPVYEDFEVEVTIADYATWRPLGSISDPTQPGNTLVARAVLKPKGAAPKTYPAVKAFRFELLDTSREPGVCLNWPLGAKDDDFDLRLATATTGGDLSARDQKLTVTNAPAGPDGRPFAETMIECFDFGARAELRVICELEDGRELIGLMKDEGGQQDLVRLPKMKGPDWIAEAWRREKDVLQLAAGYDAEKVEGQKADGDGFTLYEEYRGWVVNGQHVEGDPKRKDFFVLNLIGADGQNGIDLFERLSQLRVHSKLRRSEMSQTTRLMNGNRRDAPHRVNQHGVWVKTFTREKLGDNGADTRMTKAGVAGRPGITEGIGILARGDTESIFNQPFNLPARDTILAYDRAIAHELLHSVGVEHHGSGDYQRILGYVSPRNPHNKVGRPYYAESLNAAPTVVLDESGHDLAAKNYPEYVKFRQVMDAAMLDRELAAGADYIARNGAGYGGINSAQQYADQQIEVLTIFPFMNVRGIVGVQHGAHSGHQDCVMRYYFAKFYEAAGQKDTLYVATPGTERIGIDICRAGTGTGINAPGHKPQSRYGNAGAGGGDCFSQICPNDAIPPRKTSP
jgi:hypothetical protein